MEREMSAPNVPEPPKGFKERLYDRIRIPLWALDVVIVLLFVALIAVVIIGTR